MIKSLFLQTVCWVKESVQHINIGADMNKSLELNFWPTQCSVATQLRCGGIFSHDFTTNFPQNVPVKNI